MFVRMVTPVVLDLFHRRLDPRMPSPDTPALPAFKASGSARAGSIELPQPFSRLAVVRRRRASAAASEADGPAAGRYLLSGRRDNQPHLFSHGGVVSLVVGLSNGEFVEAGVFGRNSVIGVTALLDGPVALNRAIAQVAG